jgi:hypothetical protein
MNTVFKALNKRLGGKIVFYFEAPQCTLLISEYSIHLNYFLSFKKVKSAGVVYDSPRVEMSINPRENEADESLDDLAGQSKPSMKIKNMIDNEEDLICLSGDDSDSGRPKPKPFTTVKSEGERINSIQVLNTVVDI